LSLFKLANKPREQTLQGFVEPSDNPFDNQGEILGKPKRGTEAGKTASEKKKRERNRQHHKDKDIDLEIQQHGEDNVRIIQNSNP
jgi:hypothetical protein